MSYVEAENNYSVRTMTSLLFYYITRQAASKTNYRNRITNTEPQVLDSSEGSSIRSLAQKQSIVRAFLLFVQRATGSLSRVSHDRLVNSPNVVIVNFNTT
jgi:hypothetical protein